MSSILIVLLHTFILCRSQVINYHCNFDTNPLTGACQFTPSAGGPAMTSDPGVVSAANPKQPISDAKAISSPTMPDNEYCELPYRYQGINFDMYFCRRFSATNFTCPTKSGTGQCNAGRLGLIRPPATAGLKDFTYTANVDGGTNSEQCLDFYYYITDITANAKMQIGWKNDEDEDTGLIIEVAAVPSENKWQRRQVSFIGPPSLSSYKLTVRIMRDAGILNFFFALDEMYIYDQPCAGATTTIPSGSTPVIEPTTTKEIESGTTTLVPTTTAASVTTTTTVAAVTTTTTVAPIITTTTVAPIITTTTIAPITTTTTAAPIITTTTVAAVTTTTTVAPITTAAPKTYSEITFACHKYTNR
ncbi:unnamed protein product [Adineta steineri]|uniref:MAM domain-containing protein n=1 Tax=Adineta steineri TaxID=433720 RepID=A0A814MU53_9BILA|nr:unnamed protein product [Adineta steineri]CAF4133766.1 unnamed protein product [Adineta steineri]